jgi:RNA polymerase sigma-70 factor (ECF subfamily)
MDEIALIAAARQGDPDAFNRLVLAYQDMAYNLAYRMLGEESRAEECTQDAFFAAYRNLNSFRGGSFKSWVLRMVNNACIDELRRRKRRPLIPLEPLHDDEEVESPAWLADTGPTPEETAATHELDQAITHCLQTLTPDARSVIVLADVEELGYEEVAAALHTPLGTVKSRLARARLKMQDCLQGFMELLPTIERLEGEGK